RLVREVFRLQQENPDEAIIAFFGEPREATLEFAAAYRQVVDDFGKVEGLDYFLPPPGGRSSATNLIRQPQKKPDGSILAPPEKTLGVVLHVRGDLIFPRLNGEAGL